jgi:hypothetical protein
MMNRVVATLHDPEAFAELLFDDSVPQWFAVYGKLEFCISCGREFSDRVDEIAAAYVIAVNSSMLATGFWSVEVCEYTIGRLCEDSRGLMNPTAEEAIYALHDAVLAASGTAAMADVKARMGTTFLIPVADDGAFMVEVSYGRRFK